MHLRSGLIRTDGDKPHEECRPAAMTRDESQVTSLREHLQQTMTNPFKIDDHPKNLAYQLVYSQQQTYTNHCFMLCQTGNRSWSELMKILSIQTEAPIPRSGLKTFTDMTKKAKVKMDAGTLHVNISPESVLRRALTIASTREDVTTKTLLSLPIDPVPTSLFHDDGTMRKCSKADLIHKLKEPIGRCNDLPEFDACSSILIRDVMAVIQALPVQQYHSVDDLAHEIRNVEIQNTTQMYYCTNPLTDKPYTCTVIADGAV